MQKSTICNCSWEITDDKVLVISPIKGTDGKLEMQPADGPAFLPPP